MRGVKVTDCPMKTLHFFEFAQAKLQEKSLKVHVFLFFIKISYIEKVRLSPSSRLIGS